MCSHISLILSEHNVYYPVDVHSHERIAERHSLPTSLFGDRYARIVVRPRNGRYRNLDGTLRMDTHSNDWVCDLDELRKPSWWADDPLHHEDRARKAARCYLETCLDYHIPGYNVNVASYQSLIATAPKGTLHLETFSRVVVDEETTIYASYYNHIVAKAYATVRGQNNNMVIVDDHSLVELNNHNHIVGGRESAFRLGGYNTLTTGESSQVVAGSYNHIVVGPRSVLRVGSRCVVTARLNSYVQPGPDSLVFFQPESESYYTRFMINTNNPETPPNRVYFYGNTNFSVYQSFNESPVLAP